MRKMVRTMVAVALLGSAGLAHSIGACGRWGCGLNSPVVEGADMNAAVAAATKPRSRARPAQPVWGVNLNSPLVDGGFIANRKPSVRSTIAGVISSPCPKWGCGENSPVVEGARTGASAAPSASMGDGASRRVSAR